MEQFEHFQYPSFGYTTANKSKNVNPNKPIKKIKMDIINHVMMDPNAVHTVLHHNLSDNNIYSVFIHTYLKDQDAQYNVLAYIYYPSKEVVSNRQVYVRWAYTDSLGITLNECVYAHLNAASISNIAKAEWIYKQYLRPTLHVMRQVINIHLHQEPNLSYKQIKAMIDAANYPLQNFSDTEYLLKNVQVKPVKSILWDEKPSTEDVYCVYDDWAIFIHPQNRLTAIILHNDTIRLYNMNQTHVGQIICTAKDELLKLIQIKGWLNSLCTNRADVQARKTALSWIDQWIQSQWAIRQPEPPIQADTCDSWFAFTTGLLKLTEEEQLSALKVLTDQQRNDLTIYHLKLLDQNNYNKQETIR